MSKEFLLFDVEVYVYTKDGMCDVQDWDRRDIEAAKHYAEETAFCENVVKTIFKENDSQIETFNDKLYEIVTPGTYRCKEDGEVITFENELAA